MQKTKLYVFEKFLWCRNITEQDIPLYKDYLEQNPSAKIKFNGRAYSIWDWQSIATIEASSRRKAIKSFLQDYDNLNGIRVRILCH